jgi:hypothetical protein
MKLIMEGMRHFSTGFMDACGRISKVARVFNSACRYEEEAY